MRIAILTALVVAGCGGSCGLNLERMIDQPRYTAYEACDVCPRGTIMMLPPTGTVARTAPLDPPELALGRTADGKDLTAVPLPVDAALLRRGRNRFDIYCAACHGRLGNGLSQVAEMMSRRPPDLHAEPYASRTPGHVYAVVTGGYGLMRSYANELSVRDRWAVVAYLDVLRLARGVQLSELPPELAEEARRWLK
ncbi:MAG: cytochrome c [Deltaproteobacteria bacterium]|nr:cytochrome c [Deltaproteobacteria bacterium]MCW5808603.1 cytochrome c [Deltaproteobacteria bacterium]